MADKCIRQQWFSPKALSVIFPILQPTFPTRCLIDHTEPLLLCYYSAMHWIGFISRITMALWPYVPISTAPIKQKAAIDVHLISHVPCRLWASMVLSLMEPVSLWILRQGIHKTRKKKTHTHNETRHNGTLTVKLRFCAKVFTWRFLLWWNTATVLPFTMKFNYLLSVFQKSQKLI